MSIIASFSVPVLAFPLFQSIRPNIKSTGAQFLHLFTFFYNFVGPPPAILTSRRDQILL